MSEWRMDEKKTQYFTPPKRVHTDELRVGDHVEMDSTTSRPFAGTIVRNVDKDYVYLFRPYGTHADFTCTSGVICYIGLEDYKVERHSQTMWLLYERPYLK